VPRSLEPPEAGCENGGRHRMLRPPRPARGGERGHSGHGTRRCWNDRREKRRPLAGARKSPPQRRLLWRGVDKWLVPPTDVRRGEPATVTAILSARWGM